MPFYQLRNGYHPLVASFIEAAPSSIKFVIPDGLSGLDGVDVEATQRVMFRVMEIAAAVADMPGAPEPGPERDEFFTKLIVTRDPPSQMIMETHSGKADLILHHTTPLHMSSIPFLCHIETLTSLFFPFLEGKNTDIDLPSQPVFAYVKWLLEHHLCRGVFTHLKSTQLIMLRSFNSEKIARKTRYVPLGISVSADLQSRIDKKFSDIPKRKGLNILFTNSANTNLLGIFLRGAGELLHAFAALLNSHPDAKLTILSKRPPDRVLEDFSMTNVTWIDQGISDAQLFELLLDADVFALPAAYVHSYSVLRAFAFGAVLICSDAPGYEEYVIHEQTAFVVPGRMAQYYNPDPQTGWMREDSSACLALQPSITMALLQTLIRLAKSPTERLRIASAARSHVLRAHALEPWVNGIATLLEEARQ